MPVGVSWVTSPTGNSKERKSLSFHKGEYIKMNHPASNFESQDAAMEWWLVDQEVETIYQASTKEAPFQFIMSCAMAAQSVATQHLPPREARERLLTAAIAKDLSIEWSAGAIDAIFSAAFETFQELQATFGSTPSVRNTGNGGFNHV